MSRTIDSTNDFQSFQDDEPTAAQQVQEQLRGKTVCPFCGNVNESPDAPCPRCTMENSSLTRQATKARLGPWYVLQTRNPSAPGMKYSVLLSLVKKGQITPRSIVRGPTTNQFWKFAAKVKGLSREFGMCWGCGSDIETTTQTCPNCQRTQLAPTDPDQLLDGRQPIAQILPVRREIRPTFAGPGAQPPVEPTPPVTAPRREQVAPPPPAYGDVQAAREATARERRAPASTPAAPPEPVGRHPRRDLVAARLPAADVQHDDPYAGTAAIPQPSLPGRMGAQPMLPPQTQVLVRPRPMDPEPQQPLGKVLLLLTLMALFTAAGWLYVDTNSRTKLLSWTKTQWASLTGDGSNAAATTPTSRRESANELKGERIVINPPTPPVATPPPATPPPPAPAPQAQAPAPTPPAAQQPPPGVKLAEVVPPPAPPVEQKPEPKPVAPPAVAEVKVEAPRTPPPAPARVTEPKPAQTEAPKGRGGSDTTAQADPAPTDLGDAIRQSRKLYRQAVDAEANSDYRAAVKLYEEIGALPAEAWPGDLQLRLNGARERAKQ